MRVGLAMAIAVMLIAGTVFAKSNALLKNGEPFYEFRAGEVLVQFKPGTDVNAKTAAAARCGARVAEYNESLEFYRMELAASTTTTDAVAYFRSLPEVEWANFNYVAHAAWTPNDTYYSYQWHYPRMNLPQAWDITRGAASVVVAVVDAGFYLDHEDWAGVQIVSPRDEVDNDNTPLSNVGDSHGAHVAGTIIAATNNNLGVAGVAPLCSLMPVRVLGDDGGGTSARIASGIQWATNHSADVINLSLGFVVGDVPPQDPGPPLSTAITNAAAAGVVICAATHNQGRPWVAYPAAYPACIAVGATGFDDAIAPYSNYGDAIDIVAPGGNTLQDLNQDGYEDGVLSTQQDSLGNDYYVFWQGTSMATPHAAGLAALLLSNGTAPADVRSAMQETAVDRGTSGWDVTYGYGRINAYAALQWQGGGGGEVVLLEEGFESAFPPANWSIYATGTPNPENWEALAGNSDAGGGTTPHGGSNAAFHDDDDTGGLQVDWLVTPSVQIPANASSYTLRFFERNYYMANYYDHHGVMISNNGTNFAELAELDDDHPQWTEISITRTQDAGQTLWFAFYYQGDYATEWFIDDVRITAVVPTSAGRANSLLPVSAALHAPYPNPFNSMTTIPYDIAVAGPVELSVYNLLGQRVATLVSAPLSAGTHRVVWDAGTVSSGTYIVKLHAGETSATQKILLVK
ncbi:MAG: S8 family serine peptidase [Calditrichota bacterium]